jgi:DNA-binding PadR family transcriptional regulator
MMYELIILSQLMRHPAHGYLIARIINDMIGPYARISNGRLYPLLSKLEQSRLIVPYDEGSAGRQGDRQLRAYKITEDGQRRFHELMMDTTSNPGDYQKLFLHKAPLLDLTGALNGDLPSLRLS